MKSYQFQITKLLIPTFQSITKSKINVSPIPMLHYSQSSSATMQLTTLTNPKSFKPQATNYVFVSPQYAFKFQSLLINSLSASHTDQTTPVFHLQAVTHTTHKTQVSPVSLTDHTLLTFQST